MDEHLAECEACRAELEAMKSTAALVGSLTRVKAPKGLVEDIKARLVRRPAAVRTRRRPVILRWVGVGGWVAAAATLIVVIKLAPWEGSPPEPAPQPPAKIAAPSPKAKDKAEEAKRALKQDRDARVAKAADGKAGRAAAKEAETGAEAKQFLEKTMRSAWAVGGAAPAEMDTAIRAKVRRAVQTPPKPAPTGAMYDAAEGGVAPLPKKRMVEQANGLKPPFAPRKAAGRTRYAGEPKAARRRAGIQRTLTYVCADVKTGLADVRNAVTAVRGTLVADEEQVRANNKVNEVIVSIPVDRLPKLVSALKLQTPTKDKMRGNGGGSGVKDAAKPEMLLGRKNGNGMARAGKGSSTVTVRILLKPESKP